MLPTKFRFIWPNGFRGEDFKKNRPIRNKNCLWRPCLLMDWNKMSRLYKGPSIDASYQVSVHLAEGFQRRRLKCEKRTVDRKRMTDTKWWQKLTLPLARWAKNNRLLDYYKIISISRPILTRPNMGLDFVSGQYGCLFSRCRKYVINSLIHVLICM